MSLSYRYRTAAAIAGIATVAALSLLLLASGREHIAAATETPAASPVPVTGTASASPTASSTPSPAAVLGRHVAFSAAPGAFRRVDVAAGERIDLSQGIFFFDMASGETEAWVLTATPGSGSDSPTYAASNDNRYIVVPNQGLILDRTTGQAFRWTSGLTYLTAWNDRAVFTDGITTYLLDNEMRLIRSFPAPATPSSNLPAPLVSPDGGLIAMVTESGVAVIDLASGRIATPTSPEPASLPRGASLASARLEAIDGLEFALFRQYWPGEAGTTWTAVISRYGWDASFRSETVVAGRQARLSPDGKLIAWETTLRDDGFGAPMARVRDWATVVIGDAKGTPLFQVKGATLCFPDSSWGLEFAVKERFWAGDSSALVVNTRNGPAIITVGDRKLRQLEAGASVQPAPGTDRWLAVDRSKVVGLDGKTVSTIPTLRFKPSPLLQPWGNDAAELRFTAGEEEPGTLSSCVIGAGGSARVEKAPFSIGKIQLQVTTNGECLNLRTEPNPTATTVTCLKDGTLLDVTAGFVGTNPAPVQSDEAAGTGLFKCGAGFDFGTPVSAIEGWVHVQVAGLGEGWVSTEYVDWAN